MLSNLKHDNIIEYYTFFIENGYICIVLEACDMDLDHFLSNHFKSEKKETIDKNWLYYWPALCKKKNNGEMRW